jgi:hypothetical protein
VRNAPAYSITPLCCTFFLWNESEHRGNLPLIGFLPLKAVPLIEVRRYKVSDVRKEQGQDRSS